MNTYRIAFRYLCGPEITYGYAQNETAQAALDAAIPSLVAYAREGAKPGSMAALSPVFISVTPYVLGTVPDAVTYIHEANKCG